MQGTSAALGGVTLRERARSIFVVVVLSKQSCLSAWGWSVGVCTNSSSKNPDKSTILLYKLKSDITLRMGHQFLTGCHAQIHSHTHVHLREI